MNFQEEELQDIKALEIKLIAFMLKEEKFISKILLTRGGSKGTKSFIMNDDSQFVVGQILDYYEKYGSKLVPKEFDEIIDDLSSKSEKDGGISDDDHYRFKVLFEKSHDLSYSIKEEQFDRVLEKWINFISVGIVRDEIKKQTNLLSVERDGLTFFENITANIRKLLPRKKADTDIRQLDVVNDKEQQKKYFEEKQKESTDQKAIPSGYPSFDGPDKFVGFRRGSLNIIAGLSGSGKSTLALGIAHNIYKHQKKKVLFLGFEMYPEEYASKLNSRETKIPQTRLEGNDIKKLSEKEKERLEKVIDEREGYFKIMSFPANVYTWSDVVNEIEDRYPEYEPDIIFVDYLALIRLDSNNNDRRDIQLGDLCKDIRAFGIEKNAPVVLVAQLNRSAKIRDKKQNKYIVDIQIENMEDSNKIGQDADSIIGVIKHELGDEDDELEDKVVDIEVCLVKQRQGSTGKSFMFNSDLSCSWIYDNESLYKEDWLNDKEVDHSGFESEGVVISGLSPEQIDMEDESFQKDLIGKLDEEKPEEKSEEKPKEMTEMENLFGSKLSDAKEEEDPDDIGGFL